MTKAAEIEDMAARWLLRQEDKVWSDADQAELEAWLATSPEHSVVYWRLEYGWTKVDRLGALRMPDQKDIRPAPKRRHLIWGGALAACLVGFLAFMASNHMFDQALKTEIGERKSVALTDGTKVELNTATKLRIDLDEKHRSVWLDQGEAYFEVAHDPLHPFVIHAGKRTITVLGTKFSVRRDGDRVEVAVVEGRVRVEEAIAVKSVKPAVITRGDMIIADGAAMLVAVNSVERVDAALGWRNGRLVFDHVTLADAAKEFNRYNRKKLIITDKAVADIRIGGSFEAENVDVFARLLQQGFGLKIEEDGENLKISD